MTGGKSTPPDGENSEKSISKLPTEGYLPHPGLFNSDPMIVRDSTPSLNRKPSVCGVVLAGLSADANLIS
jgi:hypothetical protein